MLSWGFIEVIGYTPAVAGADAMVKAANVELPFPAGLKSVPEEKAAKAEETAENASN